MSLSKKLQPAFHFSLLSVALMANANARMQPRNRTAGGYRDPWDSKVDGDIEDAWKDAPEVEIKKIVKSETTVADSEAATAKVKLMWDADHLYALFQVKDAKLSAKAFDDYAQDSIELFVDELNQKAGDYQKMTCNIE